MVEIIPFSDFPNTPPDEVYVPGNCPALVGWRAMLRDIQKGARDAVDEGDTKAVADYVSRFGMSPDEPLPPTDPSGVRMPRSLELSTAELYFGAAPVPGENTVEVSVCFTDYSDSVEDDPQGLTDFTLPLPDPLAGSAAGRAALALNSEVHDQRVTNKRDELQRVLCDKKRACPGSGRTGECPVFGPQGFFGTLLEVMGEAEAGDAS